MNNSPMKRFTFGVTKLDDLKRYSWHLKEMGIQYYIEPIKKSSHSICYQFYIDCSDLQYENFCLLVHMRRPKYGTN